MNRFVILLIIAALFLSACAGSQWVRTPVVKQHEFNVTLEQRQEDTSLASQRYAHPHQVEQGDLKTLLGGLTYTEEAGLLSEEKNHPVFQAAEIDRLAPVLADTLATADASQRIRFISFNHDQGVLFSVSRKTEGVMFIGSDGRLNIAFNHINLNRQASESTAIFPNYANADPLKIKSSDTPISPMAPYAQLQRFEDGKQAPMWVVVDFEKQDEAASHLSVPTKATEIASPVVAPKTESVEKAIDNPEPTKMQFQKSGGAVTSVDSLKEEHKQEIKSKLKYLKELYDEGLITEKDYNGKKMELLNKIN